MNRAENSQSMAAHPGGMGMAPGHTHTSRELAVARLCGAGAALLGIIGLLGWIFHNPILNSIIPGYKPIAISAAIMFILLGGVQMLLTIRSLSRGMLVVLLAVSAFATLFGLLEIVYLVAGIDISIEDAILRQFPELFANPNVQISPVAGILVFLIGVGQSLYLYQQVTGKPSRRLAHFIGILGSVIILISAVFALSYLYRSPFLYGSVYIPVALMAVLAALLSGIGLVATIGHDVLPLHWFSGPSTRARLLRAFLPVTALMLLLLSIMQFFLTEYTPINPAITVAVLITIFEIIIAVVVLQVARSVGNLIDRAREEQRKAEEALRQNQWFLEKAQEVAHVGSWVSDPGQRGRLRWSREVYRIFGVAEDAFDERVETFFAFIHPDDQPAVTQASRDALAGIRPYDIEHRIIRSDGTVHWVHEAADVLRDAQGQPEQMVGVVQDITERKQAEQERERLLQELRQLNETLEQRVRQRTAALEAANKELEAFSYSVSHDLRAPLRSIDGFSRILVESYQDVLDERGQDYLGRVRAAAQRMGRLIDDMLSLSRIGRTELHIQPVDVSALAASIIADLRERDPQRRVEAEIEPGLQATGDPALLRIVLDNLIGNAWKFTGKREVGRIEVGVQTMDGTRVFYVRDNGAGFDMSYADKLFSPFQRLHTEAEFPGTGIGLAIVQRIIAKHGGRVWAEGKEGEGATIYFTLGEERA